MNNNRQSIILAVGSAFLLLITSLVTNPLDNVAYAIFFLVVLFGFFVTTMNLIIELRRGYISKTARSKVLVSAFTLTAIIMLRSLQSFGSVETILLALLWALTSFYLGRKNV